MRQKVRDQSDVDDSESSGDSDLDSNIFEEVDTIGRPPLSAT